MKTYLITGATGYIGSMLVKHILLSAPYNSVQITALVRDVDKAKTMLPTGVKLIYGDITDIPTIVAIKESFDYIVHCASVTSSSYMVSNPVETANGIVDGTKNILDLARRCHVKMMVYLSSMEVYGDVSCQDDHRVAEAELGPLDILCPRSSYPLGKRMAEHFCYAYYHEYGVPVKIARLAQTFGTGILSSDNRVFAQIAKAVIRGENIVLHTDGISMGNYCAISDVLNAIMILLEKGQGGEAYNVVNESYTMSIKDMAELVTKKIAKDKIKVVYDMSLEQKYGYAPNTSLRLSATKLRNLGWQPIIGMEQMYKDLIKSLKKMEEEDG